MRPRATAFCLLAVKWTEVQALRSASRFSMMKLLIGEPPSFSGKNQFSLQESELRFSAVKGMPTGPGTSEGNTTKMKHGRLCSKFNSMMLRDRTNKLSLT